jgi:glycosyltransferase involved in cell wall biosynthesis
MRILIVQNTDWLKRNPGQQHHLAEMLSTRGHEVRVVDFEISWRTQGNRELLSTRQVFRKVHKIYQNANITVIRPSIIKIPILDYISMMFSHWRELKRQVKEFAPDIILSFGIVAYLAGREAKKNHIPFVYYWIDVSHRLIPFRLLQPVGLIIERRALKLACQILAINGELMEYVIRIGSPRGKTRVLTAGIDYAQFDPSIDRNKVGKQCGLTDKDFVLFFMGWLYHFSGLKEVAAQLAKLPDRHIKLLIVGEGDAYDELHRMRERLDLQDRLILVGRKPYKDIPAFIATSDICLLPAYPKESIMQNIVPIKMYEYMAMKKPVIASKLPGVLKEFGESNGVIYIKGPEEAVEKALELAKAGNLEELGIRARKFAERHDWERIADEFERVLQNAIRAHIAIASHRYTAIRSR